MRTLPICRLFLSFGIWLILWQDSMVASRSGILTHYLSMASNERRTRANCSRIVLVEAPFFELENVLSTTASH